jgi:acyl-coenzyme A thioesterase PaaI-like protein
VARSDPFRLNSGDVQPAALLLGARPIKAGEGTCTFSMPATGWLTSPTGLVLRGVTACPADFAPGAAMRTTVPAGTAVALTDLRVQFIRPRQATAAR